MLGKIEGRKRRGWQRMRRLNNITNSMDMNLSKWEEAVKDRVAWCAAVHGVAKIGHNLVTEQQQHSWEVQLRSLWNKVDSGLSPITPNFKCHRQQYIKLYCSDLISKCDEFELLRSMDADNKVTSSFIYFFLFLWWKHSNVQTKYREDWWMLTYPHTCI